MENELQLNQFSDMERLMNPLSEIALVGLSLISIPSSYALLATSDAPEWQRYALEWFILPLMGALCSSVCAMLLNPRVEARKQVFARAIFGVVMGTALPKAASVIYPPIKSLSLDPAIAFLAGFFVCMFFYIVSRPFIEKLYGRADDMGEHMAEQVEQKLTEVTVTKTKKEVKTVHPENTALQDSVSEL